MEGIDVDNIVRHWIPDVPYIWYDDKDWKKAKRKYIFSMHHYKIICDLRISLIKGFASKDADVVRACRYVKNYFMCGTYFHLSYDYLKNIRVNGSPAYFPKVERIDVDNLYSYLGLSHPNIDDMKKFLHELLQEPKQLFSPIILPSPKYEKSKVKLRKNEAFRFYGGLWYLSNVGKYEGVCTIISEPWRKFSPSHRATVTIADIIDIHIYVDSPDFKNVLIDFGSQKELIHLCMKNKKIKRIFINLSWQIIFAEYAHANLLIIDKEYYKVYLFDPWGKTEFEETITVMPALMKRLGLEMYDWEYIPSIEWCPIKSFQQLEKYEEEKIDDYSGYCAIWTLWIIDTLLRNPDVEYDTIIRKALQSLAKEAPDFRDFIRRYAKAIEKYSDMLREEIGVDIPEGVSKPKLSEEDTRKFNKYAQDLYDRYYSSLSQFRKGRKWDLKGYTYFTLKTDPVNYEIYIIGNIFRKHYVFRGIEKSFGINIKTFYSHAIIKTSASVWKKINKKIYGLKKIKIPKDINVVVLKTKIKVCSKKPFSNDMISLFKILKMSELRGGKCFSGNKTFSLKYIVSKLFNVEIE